MPQPRYIKNTVILVKNEATPGVDAEPAGATDAMLISEMSITPLDAQNIARNNIRGYFGASEELVGAVNVKISITVELAGSGTAATPPAWAAPIKSCAVAEGLLTTPARCEYYPASTGLKTSTIYYYDDGVLHKAIGSMGEATLTAKVGQKPQLKFDFVGVEGGVSAATAAATLTAWKTPVPVTKANVVDITLGASYAAGAITGGIVYPSNGLELKFGNKVDFNANLSNESVDVSDRQSTGSVELELTAAQEVAMYDSVRANTLQSLAFQIGLNAGNKIIVFAPAVQLTAPKKVDVNGRRYIGYDLRFLPSAAGSGNDEWRIVTQ